MQVTVQYYAIMREQADRSVEVIETTAITVADLYAELASKYAFTLSSRQLKVAVNAEFSDWGRPLATGDSVVFLPPVAGG